METSTFYTFRAYGRISTLTFDTQADALLATEDAYGVDNPEVIIVKVTTHFEVVS